MKDVKMRKNSKKPVTVKLAVDELIHCCIDAILMVADMHINKLYSVEKANQMIQDKANGDTRKMILLTEYVNATVRIFNIFMSGENKDV
jgi:hypothetical protein